MADDIDGELQRTRERLQRTSSDLTEKIELLQERMRRNLDPRYQFDRYPWPILGGSVVLGFILGSLRPSRAEELGSGAPLKQRKLRGVEDTMAAEFAGLKGMAIGAVIKLLVNMVKQSLLRSGGTHAGHGARNGGDPHERLEAAKY